MSTRSYVLKSVAVLFSVALVSGYIYQRSRSDLVPYQGDGGAPDARAQLLPGSKSAATAVLYEAKEENGSAKAHSGKWAGDKSAMLIPSTKSAVIFSINQIPAGAAAGAGQRP
jgi:hypothetical protein